MLGLFPRGYLREIRKDALNGQEKECTATLTCQNEKKKDGAPKLGKAVTTLSEFGCFVHIMKFLFN